jgi:hypothetical protein
MGPTTRDRMPTLAAGGWPAGPISRRTCSRERRTGERPTGGPERQRQQVSGLRGVIPRVGRIRGSQPKLGFSFFIFIFFSLSFQIQVVFKFNSNSCDQLLQFILATFRDTNSGGIYLHILFIYTYPLSLSLLHISRIPFRF